MSYKLAFIGAGNMAEAIARAAIDHHVVPAKDIIAADPSPERRDLFRDMGVDIAANNAAAVKDAQQILLAVKPQMFTAVAAELAEHLRPEQVVISIMAGVTTAKLAAALAGPKGSPRIVRAMPNTPLMVGRGMTGLALAANAKAGDDELAMRLFSAAGQAVRVDEAQLDAVTAVSGSGPAYLFYLAEAMQQAAEELGLGEDARLLVAQTLLGASELLKGSPRTATELRRQVTSPGGTTQAAIEAMDRANVRDSIVSAIRAAHARSKELGA